MSHQSVFIGRKISSETKSWLINENVSFEEHALIQIVLNEPDYSLFSSIKSKPKQFVISSQWAAKWLVKFHYEIGFDNTCSMLCLSEKQREICFAITNNIFVTHHQNAGTLAQLTFEKNCGEQVVYLHGNLSLKVFELKMKSFGVQFLQVEIASKLVYTLKLMNYNLFDRALQVIPGGVNSPVRSFKGVGKQPIFIKRAEGSWLYGADGKKYLDYVGSWGPMIFGHAWSPLIEALKKQLELSTSIGLVTEKEVQFAELLVSMVPNVEKVRLVNSGTEACMTAVRIARGVTGKQKIIKFNGCYHGHADAFLVQAGSGALTLGKPSSDGVLPETVKNTLVAEFNNLQSVETIFENHRNEIAAVIIEPVAGNMGCIPPSESFLKGLQSLATKNTTCLIFDEVMTGFRLAVGGAQELYSVEADLVTFGKIIGGGIPVGAVAGKSSWMDCLAPLGPVYQAGTLSGNPLATAAGITMLSELKNNPSVYELLEKKGKQLEKGLADVFHQAGVPVQFNRVSSMISIFFNKNRVETFADVDKSDMNYFAAFFHQMLENGVHLPPSGYESWFLATSLTADLIDYTIEAAEKSLKKI